MPRYLYIQCAQTYYLTRHKVITDSNGEVENIQRNPPHSYPTQPLFTTIETNKDPHFWTA